jgi:hypothetical protein
MKRRLVGDHEEEEHKQGCHTPRRSSGPVKRIPLRERYKKRNTAGGQAVDKYQQEQGEKHAEELNLIEEILEHGLIVNVPCEAHDEEEYENEEAEVDGERELV